MSAIDRNLHESLGAAFGELGGLELPETYGDPVAEYRAVREAAGLLDRSPRGRLSVRGGDRGSFLQRLLSNDVSRLAPGEGTHALLLTPKGRLISDLRVWEREDDVLLDCPAAARPEVVAKLTMYVLSSDVTVTDLTDDLALLGIYGPAAGRVLGGLFPGELPDGPGRHRVLDVMGTPVTLTWADPLGVPGYEAHFPAPALPVALPVLRDSGATLVGFRAAECLRIAAGRPRFGAEMDGNLLPPEIPFLAARAVSTTKGCFVGQETIGRLKHHGRVNRELRTLHVRGADVPPSGSRITVGDRQVGEVTSSCLPPDHDHPIALGFVHRSHNEPGTEVEVELPGGKTTAVLAV